MSLLWLWRELPILLKSYLLSQTNHLLLFSPQQFNPLPSCLHLRYHHEFATKRGDTLLYKLEILECIIIKSLGNINIYWCNHGTENIQKKKNNFFRPACFCCGFREPLSSFQANLCSLCQRHAKLNNPCKYARTNGLQPDLIPNELKRLTWIELHLLRILTPFQSLLFLPRGQHGVRGQIVHIPMNITTAFEYVLQRNSANAFLSQYFLVNLERPSPRVRNSSTSGVANKKRKQSPNQTVIKKQKITRTW